jgi:hypothetical protein
MPPGQAPPHQKNSEHTGKRAKQSGAPRMRFDVHHRGLEHVTRAQSMPDFSSCLIDPFASLINSSIHFLDMGFGGDRFHGGRQFAALDFFQVGNGALGLEGNGREFL